MIYQAELNLNNAPFRVKMGSKFGLHKTNLNSFNLVNSEFKDVEEVDVELIDFADYVREINGVDFVRMDVEGHEHEIFKSLNKLLTFDPSLAPRTIIFETHKYEDIDAMKDTLSKLFKTVISLNIFQVMTN